MPSPPYILGVAPLLLLQMYVTGIAFTGFITLIFGSPGGVQAGSLLIDGFAFLLGGAAVVWHRPAYSRRLTIILLGFLVTGGLVLTRAIGGGTGLGQALNAARGWLLPMLPAAYIIAAYPSSRLIRLRHILSAAFLFLGVFGLFQYAFAAQLPDVLLTPRSDEVFGFYDTSHIRPTALIGNPIIYATVMVLGTCWAWSHWLVQRRFYDLMLLSVCLMAGGLTVTRAALVGSFAALAVIYLVYRRFRPLPTMGLLSGVAMLSIAAYAWLTTNPQAFLARRLLGTESTTQGSDRVHFAQVRESIETLRTHWVVGLGVGSQSPGSKTYIVTDGLWWAAALDFGLIVLGLLVAIGGIMIAYLLRVSSSPSSSGRPAALAAVGFLTYAVPASIINSASGSRVSLSLIWLVLALALAPRRR